MTAGNARSSSQAIQVDDGGAQIRVQEQGRTDLFSTFRVGGPADYVIRAKTEEEILLALDWARDQKLPVTVFGGGSNMLVSDKGIRGVVVVVRRPGRDLEEAMEIEDENETQVRVTIPATAPLSWLGRTAANRGWAGLSWAVGLPGNLGGATVNNAGAHGTEFKDNLVRLRLADRFGNIEEYDRDWLAPEYRRTRLKAQGNPRDGIVLDVTLDLQRADAEKLQEEAVHNADYRHRTQPTGACAGSIFKNPPGTYSGLIIEECGLKGTRVGGAVVSPKHANFIVNEEGATAADIVALIDQVRDHVRRETGIELETEIERVGEW